MTKYDKNILRYSKYYPITEKIRLVIDCYEIIYLYVREVLRLLSVLVENEPTGLDCSAGQLISV